MDCQHSPELELLGNSSFSKAISLKEVLPTEDTLEPFQSLRETVAPPVNLVSAAVATNVLLGLGSASNPIPRTANSVHHFLSVRAGFSHVELV